MQLDRFKLYAFFDTHLVEMPTKYELMTELRALNKGRKPLPIGRMKKGEIEQQIRLIKGLQEALEADGPAPKAKPGPLGPRRVPVVEMPVSDVVIKTPVAPAKRLLARRDESSLMESGPRVPMNRDTSSAAAAGEVYVKSRASGPKMPVEGDDAEMEAEVRRIVLALKRERAMGSE